MKDKNLTRVFLGKLSGFQSKQERNFEKKHLKSYLRGDVTFSYGYDNERKPKFYKVLSYLGHIKDKPKEIKK